MKTGSISDGYYSLVCSAEQTLDIKVKSPWPAQVNRAAEFKDIVDPHIIVRKARDGMASRIICLEPESYRDFCRRANDPMGESPYFEKAQEMIADFERAGGLVRRISGSLDVDLSFAIADSAKAVSFVGAWSVSNGFRRHTFTTNEGDANLVKFLSKAFALCWEAK